MEHPSRFTASHIGGAACLLPKYRKNKKPVAAHAILSLNREDDNRVEKTEISGTHVKLITTQLDLQVKSFLFQQIMKYSDKREMQTILSNDKKFAAAIQDMGKEFERSHNRLFYVK